MPGLGWLKDPIDDRDFKATYAVPPTMDVRPPPRDLRPLLDTAWDQKDDGKCVAEGITALIYADHFKQLGTHSKVIRASVDWLWGKARAERGMSKVDTGMWARQGFRLIQSIGIPPLHYCPEDWPFDQQIPKLADMAAKDQAADHATKLKRRAIRYERLAETGSELVSATRLKVFEGYPVGMGWQVPKRLTKGDIDPAKPFDVIPDEPMAGGHYMVVVATLDTGDFLLRNSWGRGFGLDGHFAVSPSFIAKGDDAWIVTSSPLFSGVKYF